MCIRDSLTVEKAWDDDGNASGIRPPSVDMQLLKDGEPFGDQMCIRDRVVMVLARLGVEAS